MTDNRPDLDTLAPHNVVAVFPEASQARWAIDALLREGIDEREISMLVRDTREVVPQGVPAKDVPSAGASLARDAARKAVTGGGVGALAGLLAGALSFAIPGIGPVISTGIWIAVTAGAVTGATTGGVLGGFDGLWHMRYRDMVHDGRVLVGVHTIDPDRAARAYAALEQFRPIHLAHFDEHGRSIHETHMP